VVALIRDADPQSELFRSDTIAKVTVVNGALEDLWALERAINEHEVDTVFHLGAQTIVGTARRFPFQTFEANIRGTYNLLEACRLHQTLVKRVVVASSDKAYGDQVKLPYTEDTTLQGRYPYDVSKSCSDLIAQSYFHTYALPIAIARCGNIYGGGDLNWSRVVPGTIRSILRSERPIIRSDGKFIRDYIYVKDAAHAYLRLAECLSDVAVQGQGFNFSIGKPLTVLEIVGTIQKMMDAEQLTPVIQNAAKGEILSQYLSSEKATRVLQWQATCGLEKGLQETIAWYRHFLG
jgi:CDP-glucose 4,6-dehydratase